MIKLGYYYSELDKQREFGHALEEYYNKNFDEDFIEKAVQTYFDKYHPDSPLSK